MHGIFRKAVSKVEDKFQYTVFPKLVDYLISTAMIVAATKIKAANIGRILIDNTVLGHAVTHETAWVDTGKIQWGNTEIESGYTARIPVHSDHDESKVAKSVRYLPGIANLAKRGFITLATSKELQDEQWTQPRGRFVGYGTYDFSLFQDLKIETIHDPEYSIIITSHLGVPSMEEQRRERLKSKTDPLYQNLVSVLGPKNSQDAWHIVTAERNNCYCFLTMDFSLIRNIRAQSNNKIVQSLRAKVITPEEFGRDFAITPLPPRLFSFHSASYPVIPETNWEDSKRQKRRTK